jgi:hypothetical protein
MITAWGADGRGPPTDLLQPPDSTAPSAENDHVDVSGAKLSRSSLLRWVGRHRDQHPDSWGPSSSGHLESWHRSHPLKGTSQQLLGESARTHF